MLSYFCANYKLISLAERLHIFLIKIDNLKQANNGSGKVFLFDPSDNDKIVRLDIFLSSRLTALSRARIQTLIKRGEIRVNDCLTKPNYKLKAGDHVYISIPSQAINVLEPEAVDFNVIYEDESILVLNKPAGLVVHPAPGHTTGTLVHGLLQHCKHLSGIGGVIRPGIVHRLDKDTSGLLVVAKSDHAHENLSGQFSTHTVRKQYLAIVHGRIKCDEGKIDLPVGRHPTQRKKMAIVFSRGRSALTEWKKIEEFPAGCTLLSISIKTGRTHQIRVHFSHTGHPVIGDTVYGYGPNWWKNQSFPEKDLMVTISRQMLHSKRLGIIHPDSGRYMEFEAPVPDDMEIVLKALRK